MRRTDHDGFTQIELLTVVVVIGVLASIAYPTYLAQRNKGWQAQLTAGVRNAAIEVEAAMANGGVYPPDQAAFEGLDLAVVDQITLTYDVNGTRTEFCVTGVDARLQPPDDIVTFASGHGLRMWQDCPAFAAP